MVCMQKGEIKGEGVLGVGMISMSPKDEQLLS